MCSHIGTKVCSFLCVGLVRKQLRVRSARACGRAFGGCTAHRCTRPGKLVLQPVSKVELGISSFHSPRKVLPEPLLKLEPSSPPPRLPPPLPDWCWSGIRDQTRTAYLGLTPPRLVKIFGGTLPHHRCAGRLLFCTFCSERGSKEE